MMSSGSGVKVVQYNALYDDVGLDCEFLCLPGAHVVGAYRWINVE